MSEEKVDPVDALHYIRDDIDVVANLVHAEIERLISGAKSAFVAGFHAGWDCGVVDELPTDDETIEEQWQEFVSEGLATNG